MELKELRQKTSSEIQKRLQDIKAQLVELRFNVVAGNTKDLKDLHNLKKEIARINTILQEKALNSNNDSEK